MKNNISVSVVAGLILGCASIASAENVLYDAGFEDPVGGAGGTPWSFTGIGTGSPSAAYGWGIYNLNDGTTVTWEESPPSGLTGSGSYSLLTSASSAGNGFGDALIDDYSHLYISTVSGYVYLESGSVGIALFDSSNSYAAPIVLASTSTTGQWINLSATANASNVSDFMLLALSPNTEFYADNMDAETPTPEPASMALLGIGACGLLCRKVKASRQGK